mgnify:CR=1 FL=1
MFMIINPSSVPMTSILLAVVLYIIFGIDNTIVIFSIWQKHIKSEPKLRGNLLSYFLLAMPLPNISRLGESMRMTCPS